MGQKIFIAIFITTIMVVLFTTNNTAFASTNGNEWTNQQLERVSFHEIKGFWNNVVDEYGGYLPEVKKTSFLEFMKNQQSISIKDWLLAGVKYLFHEFIINGKLLGSLIFLTLFCTILQSLQNAFESQAVSKVAYAIVYLVLIVLALNSFHLAVSYAKDAVDTMSSFMIALLPLMLGVMATFGNIAAVAFFHPVILFLINASGLLISSVVMPLFFLSALLNIVSTLNENYKVTQLANLLRNIGMGIMGVFLTVFLGVISVQGAASAVSDGVAMKTAKFVTGNFVPVVGRMFTDATDTVLSASLLLKNTVGLVGVVIILGLALFPAVKVFAVSLIYKFAAAIMQPIGGGPVISSMETISKHILYVLASLLVVTFMFFLAIVILVASSNLTMMIR